MNKDISYDLNKKHMYKVIFFDLIFLIILIIINFCWLFFEDGFDSANNILIAIGLPFFAFFSGIFIVLLDIYLNIRVFHYIQKKVLEVSNERIKYYSYFDKRIVIKKENIERMYTTYCHDGISGNNKYIGVVTKKPINKIGSKKFKLINILRTNNLLYTLYINVSELNDNPEIIANEIENTLSTPIKKKKENSYF